MEGRVHEVPCRSRRESRCLIDQVLIAAIIRYAASLSRGSTNGIDRVMLAYCDRGRLQGHERPAGEWAVGNRGAYGGVVLSRLDSVIRRLEAQRACLDLAARAIRDHEGTVLELGLGNGRTYDHLRERLPDREIIVFEREVRAHPDCIPDADHLVLGSIEETLPTFAEHHRGEAILVHSDIGTGEAERNRQLAAWLADALPPLLRPGAWVAADQTLNATLFEAQPLPAGVAADRYFLYRYQPT